MHLKFGLGKVRGHKKKMINSIKKMFIGLKNYDIKEHFLLQELISTIIHYPSIDCWKGLETYVSPCTTHITLREFWKKCKMFQQDLGRTKEYASKFFIY